ncbi:N-acetylmuramoyl-L-alanine amidase family protein, partial [Effusibacillus pohliae]|uniref:N-acetylmuramoyl-L-alanine amidase family protein n=1 Tax=Effusibacillus pohliae TaxID=232270 RepID=UPI000687D334
MDIAKRVENRLKGHGFGVLMTRTTDVYVGLSERAAMANRAKANYFLSIHINAGGGTGFESYVQPGYDSGETGRIRAVIHDEVAQYFKAHGMPDRGMKQADLAVCRETVMPACLLECGFIDSADANQLKDTGFLNGLAESIVRGVCKAHGVAYVP